MKFNLQDDGDNRVSSIDLIEDLTKNRYYAYVVKKGVQDGILFVNETEIAKEKLTSIIAKVYRVESHFNNCADRIRATQQLFIMVCTSNGEIAIFRRSDMLPLATEPKGDQFILDIAVIEHN